MGVHMRRFRLLLVLAVVGAALAVVPGIAGAHQCDEGTQDNCEDTAVADDYRPNYVPLFDLADREYGDPASDSDGRNDAQRWRHECANDGEERQQCAWIYGGQSIQEYESDEGREDADGNTEPEDTLLPRPNELHAGYSANHCFLAEGAHDCDRHDNTGEFGTHDSHGGALFVDVCLSTNPDSRWCDDGVEDTQVGVIILDHLSCPVGCFDEYHVVRPLDPEYTEKQMDGTVDAVEQISEDPEGHIVGYD